MSSKLRKNIKGTFIEVVGGLQLRFEVAEIAKKTGYSKGNVSEFLNEENKKEPSRPFLIKFCQAFGLDFNKLFAKMLVQDVMDRAMSSTKDPAVAARDSWAGGGGQAKENPRPQGQGLDKDVLLLQMIDKVNQSHEAIMSMHTEVFRSLDETRVLLNSEIVARDAVQKVTFARLAELSKGKYSADDLLEQALEVAGVRDLGSPVSKETAGTAG